MTDYRLRGPFALTDGMIDLEVSPGRPGAYVLGEVLSDLVNIRVAHVGRSDTDLNNQLHVHVGSYEHFLYVYCFSPQAAFEKECVLYHAFQPWDNPAHPKRPAGTLWRCPVCGLFP